MRIRKSRRVQGSSVGVCRRGPPVDGVVLRGGRRRGELLAARVSLPAVRGRSLVKSDAPASLANTSQSAQDARQSCLMMPPSSGRSSFPAA
jgi:hypothetical protein